MSLRRRNETSNPRPYVVPVTGRFDGNDGSWSTFMINVGEPGQNFRVLPSTSGSTTWIPLSEGCSSSDPENCPDLRGVEPFAGAKSQGYDATQSSASKLIGLYEMTLGSLDLNNTYGPQFSNHSAKYSYDTVGLGPSSENSLQLSPEIVAGVVDKQYFLGGFGLSLDPNNFGTGALPTFLSLLPNSTFRPIPSLSYGYTAGAHYRKLLHPFTHHITDFPGNESGSLVLGGFDQSRAERPRTSYPITSTNNTLSLAVQSILVNIDGNSLSATLDTNNFAHTFTASIDSTLPYLWLPRPVCDRLQQIFDLVYDNNTDMYLINSTSKQIKSNATLDFKLGASQTSNHYSVISLPYSAFNLNASWPIYENSTSYFPIRRAPGNMFILGRTFLQEAYLTVDYSRNNFSLAQAKFSSDRQDIVAIKKVSASNAHGLATGALIGIIIGAVAFLFITIILVLWFLRRRKRTDKLSLRSNSRETSQLPQTGTWTWHQSESSNGNSGDHDWQSPTSNQNRRDRISPVAFSPMTSTSALSHNEWPLRNNYELDATQVPRHKSNVSELPSSTETSSGHNSELYDRSQESTSLQPPAATKKAQLGRDSVLSGLSEMSCDTEIYEMESPTHHGSRGFETLR
jgi:hypothetical protein